MIDIEGLSKTYAGTGRPALNNVSLNVPKGAIYGILGRSGAGKSTLIRCLNLLERPTTGRITINGSDITQLDKAGLREHRLRIEAVECQARHDLRIGQHARQLLAHGGRGQPAQLAGCKRVAQGRGGGVVEHEQVEHDVGVDHHPRRHRSLRSHSHGRVSHAPPCASRAPCP